MRKLFFVVPFLFFNSIFAQLHINDSTNVKFNIIKENLKIENEKFIKIENDKEIIDIIYDSILAKTKLDKISKRVSMFLDGLYSKKDLEIALKMEKYTNENSSFEIIKRDSLDKNYVEFKSVDDFVKWKEKNIIINANDTILKSP